MLLRLLKIELFKTYSKWRSYISFLLFAFFVPLVLIIAHFSGGLGNAMIPVSGSDFLFSGNLYNGFFLAYFIMFLLFIHLPFLVTVAAGDLFAGEGTEGTYRFLLVRPVGRGTFFLSKWLVNLIYTFSLIYFLGLLTLGLGLLLEGGGDLFTFSEIFGMEIVDSGRAPFKLFQAYSLGGLSLLTVSTMALLFSVFVSNAIGPIIGAMGVMIIFYLIEFIDLSFFQVLRPFLFTHYMDVWQFVFFSQAQWGDIFPALLCHISYIMVFTLLAFAYFIRKEIHS